MEKQLTIIFMQTKCDWGWLEGVRTFHDVPHPDWIPFEHLGFHGGHVVWSGHASNGLCHIKSPCQYCLMRKLLMNQLIWGWFVFRQTHVDMSFIARVDVFCYVPLISSQQLPPNVRQFLVSCWKVWRFCWKTREFQRKSWFEKLATGIISESSVLLSLVKTKPMN